MMTKVVYSVRISEDVKRMMDSIDINWQEEIRRLIERRVREEYRKRLLDKGRKIREKMRASVSVSAAELIRRDRDER